MSDDRPLPRRGFFRLGILKAAQAAADVVANIGDELQKRRLPPSRPVPAPYRCRPPGALVGDRFLELCTKCNDCIAACPAWAIRQAEPGEFEAEYPMLEPNSTACALCDDPLPCIEACETRALMPTPRISVRLGLAMLDPTRCVVPHGEHCDFCVANCPIPEHAIRMSADGPVIVEAGCTGCGVCVVVCPEEALQVGPHVRP